MRKFLSFIAIGSFFSTVEEFLTVVVLKHDPGSYIFTLLILFPVFLTFVFFSSRLIRALVHAQPAQDLVHFFIYGLAGLMIEWFLIGLSPWSDPAANPLVMFVFQLGMFSFWATVGFAPHLFTEAGEPGRRAGKAILKFYIPYFVVAYLVGFLVSREMKFITIIGLIVLGYLVLNLFYLKYFRGSFGAAGPA